jgi:hypothetical protein
MLELEVMEGYVDRLDSGSADCTYVDVVKGDSHEMQAEV